MPTQQMISLLPFVTPGPTIGSEAGATYVGRAFKSLEAKIESTYYIKPQGLKVVDSGGGGADLKILASYSSLRNFLNISWSASANFPGYGEGRTRGSYLEEVKSTKYKLFIAMKKRVEMKWAYLESYFISDELKAALAQTDLSVYQNFGDQYVQEVFLGGEFACLINLSSESYYEHRRLIGSLDVSVDSIGGGASVRMEKISTILERHLSVNVQTFWTGVHRSPPLLINGLDELGSGQIRQADLLEYFANFENIVKEDGVYRPIRIITAQTAQDWPSSPSSRAFIDLESGQLASSKLHDYEDEAIELKAKWDVVFTNPYNYRDAYHADGKPVEDVAGMRVAAKVQIEKLDVLLRSAATLQEQLGADPFVDLGDIDTTFWQELRDSRNGLPLRQATFTPILLTHSDHTKHRPSRGSGHAPNQRKRVTMRGNDYRADSMWFPFRSGGRLQMWSLLIELEEPRPIGIRLEYMAEFADGFKSGWVVQGDELIHPTSRGTRFRRIAFRLEGEMVEAYNIEYQVHRTEYGDTSAVGTLDLTHPPGTLIGGPDHNIEYIRLAIWPKSELDEI